jgi:hypothetical protein
VFFFFFLEKNKLILVSSLILWLNNVTSLSTSYLTSIYIYIYIYNSSLLLQPQLEDRQSKRDKRSHGQNASNIV